LKERVPSSRHRRGVWRHRRRLGVSLSWRETCGKKCECQDRAMAAVGGRSWPLRPWSRSGSHCVAPACSGFASLHRLSSFGANVAVLVRCWRPYRCYGRVALAGMAEGSWRNREPGRFLARETLETLVCPPVLRAVHPPAGAFTQVWITPADGRPTARGDYRDVVIAWATNSFRSSAPTNRSPGNWRCFNISR